jgi:hypothetical protein
VVHVGDISGPEGSATTNWSVAHPSPTLLTDLLGQLVSHGDHISFVACGNPNGVDIYGHKAVGPGSADVTVDLKNHGSAVEILVLVEEGVPENLKQPAPAPVTPARPDVSNCSTSVSAAVSAAYS